MLLDELLAAEAKDTGRDAAFGSSSGCSRDRGCHRGFCLLCEGECETRRAYTALPRLAGTASHLTRVRSGG